MVPEQSLGGVPWRLDPDNMCVWRGDTARPLPPKAFAMLRYLVEHPGRVITKDELFERLWPGIVVSDSVLSVYMSDLRAVLGDTARAPQFIETVHRLGYRFIGPAPLPTPVAAAAPVPSPPPVPLRAPTPVPRLLVGREAELAALAERLAQAQRGVRQVVLVAGEAGSGKTTLVDAFVARCTADTPCWVAQGQCLDHFGAGEPHLPVLEALGRLCRAPEGPHVVEVLHQHAPTWLLQMPSLLDTAALEALHRRVLGTTRDRMLRELGEAVEVLTRDRLLVLVLEDLHWSDAATLDVLAWLAQRREPARLLLIGTYRPVDVIVRAHPLRGLTQHLTLRGHGVELPLELLTAADVAQYLTARFGTSQVATALAPAVHRRTSGNPLFMVTVVDALVRQGVVWREAEHWAVHEGSATGEMRVPESLRQLIEQQLNGLSTADQRVLEAASVAGMVCSAAAVAAGAEGSMEAVEEQCASLARRGQFLEADGVEEWPDGTVTGRYRFRHALCQEVVYERMPVGRRLRLHQQIGAGLETAYGAQAGERAAELAMHFAAGRARARAVHYRQHAAANALQRWAYQEAIGHLTTGLALLAMLPDTPARTQQEIALHLALGPILIATYGLAAPEVGQTYARAHALCQQVDDTPQLFPTLRGLWRFYHTQGTLPTAREVGEQLTRLAQRTAAPLLCLEAHDALGTTLFYLGDYATARTHLEQGIASTSSRWQHDLMLRPDMVPEVRCLAIAATTLWCLGYPTQASQRSQEALTLAQVLAHPYSLGLAQHQAAYLSARCRHAPTVQRWAEALLTLATAHGFPFYKGLGTCWQGWALVMQGQEKAGLAQLQQGLTAVRATGQRLGQPLCLVLFAEAAGQAGHIEEGLRLLAEARTVCEATGRGDMLAEAYRLQGELLLRQAIPDVAQAEACLHEARAISRRQQAPSWELRAAMSLSRLWQQQGKRAEAYALLAPIYGWFTEGFDTADLQEAKTLLHELEA